MKNHSINPEFDVFLNLKDVKEEILKLDPRFSSSNYLEHLIQNALEIMIRNDCDIGKTKHILKEQEIYHLINSTINMERIEYFNKAILLQNSIPSGNLSISDIPLLWSISRTTRFY